jgi:hypothetical protein
LHVIQIMTRIKKRLNWKKLKDNLNTLLKNRFRVDVGRKKGDIIYNLIDKQIDVKSAGGEANRSAC